MSEMGEKLLRAQIKGELRQLHHEGLIERVGFGEDGEALYQITDGGRAHLASTLLSNPDQR